VSDARTTAVKQLRRELAELLKIDLGKGKPNLADRLRLDAVTGLKVSHDVLVNRMARGLDVDPSKLREVGEALGKLLPSAVMAPPEEKREDPRAVMFREYLEMRRRGEWATKQRKAERGSTVERENETLRAEVDRLRAQLGKKQRKSKAAGNVVPLKQSATPGVGDDEATRRAVLASDTVTPPPPSFDYNAAMPYVNPDGSISGGGGVIGKDWSDRRT
jgi:hypothetical protein